MYRPLALFIGLRYTRTRRREKFISFVSLISLLGMVLGVFALIVVMSVMNGFEAELRQRILALVPHGYLDAPNLRLQQWESLAARVDAHPQVTASAPYIGATAMLGRGDIIQGVQLTAIAPERERAVSTIDEHMVAGRIAALQPGAWRIVIGDILARQLGVIVGDSVTVIAPAVTVTPLGVFPRQKRFEVAGVFQVGSQLDAGAAFIHLRDAQILFQVGDAVHGLRVELEDLFASPRVLPALAVAADQPLTARDWSRTQGSLFQSVAMEKIMIMLLLLIIVAVAAFNIVSILTMMVGDKRADIAVLRSMGASPRSIMAVFMIQGLTIGAGGIALGVLAGIPVARNVGSIVAWAERVLGATVFDPRVYFISRIPSVFQWSDVVVVAAAGLVLSLLATLYPAYTASRVQPAEALRYE